MRERFRNALRGFGFITDKQARSETEAIDKIPKLDVGQRGKVSQWGGNRFQRLPTTLERVGKEPVDPA